VGNIAQRFIKITSHAAADAYSHNPSEMKFAFSSLSISLSLSGSLSLSLSRNQIRSRSVSDALLVFHPSSSFLCLEDGCGIWCNKGT
jgi:hypothetical protein